MNTVAMDMGLAIRINFLRMILYVSARIVGKVQIASAKRVKLVTTDVVRTLAYACAMPIIMAIVATYIAVQRHHAMAMEHAKFPITKHFAIAMTITKGKTVNISATLIAKLEESAKKYRRYSQKSTAH